jgi:hypothetical protein
MISGLFNEESIIWGFMPPSRSRYASFAKLLEGLFPELTSFVSKTEGFVRKTFGFALAIRSRFILRQFFPLPQASISKLQNPQNSYTRCKQWSITQFSPHGYGFCLLLAQGFTPCWPSGQSIHPFSKLGVFLISE